jgi:hypothetical protein
VGISIRARELRVQRKSEGGDVSGRHRRAPWSLPIFASFVTFALFAVTLAPPPASSSYAVTAPRQLGDVQSMDVSGDYALGAARDGFEVSEVRTAPSAPAVGIPDPGSAQAIAFELVTARGWDLTEFSCLVALWNRESNWNVYSMNSSSGAYGIPQALPGEKMASAGADWATNPATQITWGIGYIVDRYATPCGAWAHSEERGWY